MLLSLLYQMSRYRRCHHDNIMFILVIFTLSTLVLSSQHNLNVNGVTAEGHVLQGHSKVRTWPDTCLKVIEVRGEGHVPYDDDTAAAERLVSIKRSSIGDDHLSSSVPESDSRKRAKSIKTNSDTWRRKRSSRGPSHLRWLAEKLVPKSLSDDLYHPSDLHLSPLTRQTTPLLKRQAEWQRRRAESRDEDRGDGDWDSGWADNNLRIWGWDVVRVFSNSMPIL